MENNFPITNEDRTEGQINSASKLIGQSNDVEKRIEDYNNGKLSLVDVIFIEATKALTNSDT